MKISILCLEDAKDLSDEVRRLVSDSFSDVDFVSVGSVAAAKRAVRDKAFDIALLDIQVPLRDGEAANATGGLLLLDHVLNSAQALRPRYIVGITAEPHAFEEAAPKFSAAMFALIQRDVGSTEWLGQLTRFLSYVASVIGRDLNGSNENVRLQYTMAIICALTEKELRPALKAFSNDWSSLPMPDDPSFYHSTIIRAASGEHRILAVAAHEPGMPTAAALTAKVLERFRPQVVAMSGIAAATKSEIGFGDVLVAEHVWDYTTGKATESGVRPEVRSIRCDPMLVEQCTRLAMDPGFSAATAAGWAGNRPPTALRVHIGPITSGGAVVESRSMLDAILARDRKTIGLDMESYAVAIAAWYSRRPNPAVLVAKSVVDYAIPPKTDEWHAYAAYTSAAFVAEWARRFL